MNPARVVFFLFLLILCAGCGPATPQVSTLPVLPTAEPTAAATLRPTKTPTSVQKTATRVLRTPTDTPYPEPVQITPVPEPINQSGPWMMLHPDIFYTGPARIVAPVFVNADGSGWEPANLPRDPNDPPDDMDWWFGSVSSASPYAAFQGYFSEYESICIENDNYWDFRGHMLHILKLPENRIVRDFELIGDAAGEQIDRFPCTNQDGGDAPVLGVVIKPYSMHWSPDGRYMAFPAAPDGPNADLYLYDTITNEVRRLTTRQNNPDILGWSPDGQTVIYRSITKMELYRYDFIESDGLYAVSISGSDRLLFETNGIPWGLEWLSQSQFLVSDGTCDFLESGDCSLKLRLLDLTTGRQEILYNNPKVFVNHVTDPIHHVILISNPPSDMPGLEGMESIPHHYLPDLFIVPGVFRFDLTTRSLQPVLLEGLSEVYWVPEDQAFRSYVTDTISPRPEHWNLIRFQPDGSFAVEKVDDLLYLSPDGNWSVGEVGEDWYILDAQNTPVQKLLSKSTSGWSSYNWAPDSSAYVQLISDDQMAMYELVVYRKENNWQPEFVRKIQYGQMWSFEWIRP